MATVTVTPLPRKHHFVCFVAEVWLFVEFFDSLTPALLYHVYLALLWCAD